LAVPAMLAACAAPAAACPFCSMQGQTLTGEVAGADLVLYGSLANANQDKETTDLVIDAVIKKHEWLKDQKRVTLPKYLPPDATSDYKYLVFCYVVKNTQLDPYRGIALKANSDIVKYLTGLTEVKDKPVGERLKFFFNYLDNADTEIANDAFKEFANADYKDYKDMAKGLPPDKVAGWLTDDKTPGFRYGLYGSLLGHCGKADKHAAVLRDLLENPKRRLSSGVDGVLAGYILLRPKEGWAYAKGLMNDPKQDFLLRYAALRTARFFWTYRPDVVDKKELAQGAALLVSQKDIVDLAVDDLRKWEQWDMTDRVLAIQGAEAYKELPVVRRAVLKFMLACQLAKDSGANAAAAGAYVEAQRKANGAAVAEAEELLKLDGGK
jgi:hypothetical protein